MTKINTGNANREYKDRLFRFVFGAEEQPDIVKLKLSDAFQIPDDSGEFEWTATMLNINYGHNQELLEQCQPLYEYAHFIKLIREYSETMELKKAIDKAVEKAREWECIGTFLYQCKSEVSVMLLTEFDEKKHEDSLIKLGEERGKELGKKEGKEEGRGEERHERMCEMIIMNFPVESIAKLYKVTVEYVLNLKKELENKATS